MIISRLLCNEDAERSLPVELFLVVGSVESPKMIIYNTEKETTRKLILDMRKAINCSTLYCNMFGNDDNVDSAVDYLIVASRRKLVLWGVGSSIERGASNERIQTSVTQCSTAITAVSCNVNKDMIVTGHENGEMLLWHNVKGWIAECTRSADPLKVSSKSGIKVNPPPCTALHWHSQTVSSLQFSIDGSLLYSGGKEGVLVIWQTMAAGTKSFVPRLGGPISHLATSTQVAKVAVASTDNSVRVINAASMRDEWCIRSACMGVGGSTGKTSQLGLSLLDEDTFASGGQSAKVQIACNSMTNQIACNGYPGQLQLLDVSSAMKGNAISDDPELNRHCSSRLPVTDTHQIVAYNRVSKMDNAVTGWGKVLPQGKLYVPSVTIFEYHSYRYAIPSSNSKSKRQSFIHNHFMASIDVTRGEEFDAEPSLKIWKWTVSSSSSRNTAKYKLVAQIDRPHSASRVTSLVFLNCNNSSTDAESRLVAGVVTSAADGSVKVWHCVMQPHSRENQQKKHDTKAGLFMNLLDNCRWLCAYSFTYRTCRTGGLSVSLDDSVLAVGYGSLLTLWDPASVELRGKLSLSCSKLSESGSSDDIADTTNSYDINSNNNIIFTSIIEPKHSESTGSGSGEAYLVAGTGVAVFVVDLLSLSILWKIGGDLDGHYIHSIAACDTSDQVICRAMEGSKTKTAFSGTSSEGWFAVCMTNSASKVENKSAPSSIAIYSPCNSEPLFTAEIPTTCSSMTFCAVNVDPTIAPSRLLLAATQSGEMLMFTSPDADVQDESLEFVDNMSLTKYATQMRGRKDLPRLSEVDIQVVGSETNGVSSTSMSTDKSKSFLNSSSSLFSESSSNMPSVSALFDGYMRNALKKKRKLDEADDDGNAKVMSETTAITSDLSKTQAIKSDNKVKKSSFSDPHFREKIQSQLFAAFSSGKVTSSKSNKKSPMKKREPSETTMKNVPKKKSRLEKQFESNDSKISSPNTSNSKGDTIKPKSTPSVNRKATRSKSDDLTTDASGGDGFCDEKSGRATRSRAGSGDDNNDSKASQRHKSVKTKKGSLPDYELAQTSKVTRSRAASIDSQGSSSGKLVEMKNGDENFSHGKATAVSGTRVTRSRTGSVDKSVKDINIAPKQNETENEKIGKATRSRAGSGDISAAKKDVNNDDSLLDGVVDSPGKMTRSRAGSVDVKSKKAEKTPMKGKKTKEIDGGGDEVTKSRPSRKNSEEDQKQEGDTRKMTRGGTVTNKKSLKMRSPKAREAKKRKL